MNELERLEQALRAAHTAGDAAAAQRFAQAIRALQAQAAPAPDRSSQIRSGVNTAMAAGDTATARVLAEEYDTLRGAPTKPAAPKPATTRRDAGREEGRNLPATEAARQGVGSAMFGVGTPITAAGAFLRSALPGGEPIMGPRDAMEHARGIREGTKEAHPTAYGVGYVGGMAAGSGAVGAVVKKLPAKARSVFSLQRDQTKRNILRMSAGGAVAGGTTAGLNEGADAVVPGAVGGGVGGAAVGTAAAVAVGVARAAISRISPDHAAIRALASKFKESRTTIANLYNDFIQETGRKPGLAEVVSRLEAGRVGQVGRQFSSAGAVLRDAEELAADVRPTELRNRVNSGGRTTTLSEQTAELAPITDVTRQTAVGQTARTGGRVRSTATDQTARRDNVMNVAMGRIGNHRIPLSDDMRDVVEDPDVQNALGGALRRRVNAAIEQGETLGSIDLSVRTWEMMRQALAGKSGAGAGQIFSRLRDRVRDYVSDRVPEYGRALTEFGRRSTSADMMGNARRAVTGDTQEFAAMLRAADVALHAPSARVAARVDVRGWLINQLNGTPRQAEQVMSRLARDNRLRTNLRAVMRPNEMQELEALGEQYGHRLNIIEGVKVGRKIVRGSDAAEFQDAVRNVSTPAGGRIGVETGARGAVAELAGESPASAVAVSRALEKDPGLLNRLHTALGIRETTGLQRAGAAFSQSARNLREAAPDAGPAQQEAAEAAQKVYNVITGVVAASGTASGALKAHLTQRIAERLKLGEKAAKRMAEYAVDPNRAAEAIRKMRAAGVREEEIMEWYQGAAVMAGIAVGGEVE